MNIELDIDETFELERVLHRAFLRAEQVYNEHKENNRPEILLEIAKEDTDKTHGAWQKIKNKRRKEFGL